MEHQVSTNNGSADRNGQAADRKIRVAIVGVGNCASSLGRKYFAVLTMPITSRPPCKPRKRAIASSASFSVARILRT